MYCTILCLHVCVVLMLKFISVDTAYIRNDQHQCMIDMTLTFCPQGVFHGATDIIVKPITGASSKGFEGFMKGIGRGAISVLVKPTLGAVDLAKYTMEGIRR